MQRLSDLEKGKGRVVGAFGGVGTGKTCLLLSQPTPHLVLACDTGSLTIPPGIDRTQIFVEEFHLPTRQFNNEGKTTPIRDIYTTTVRRLHEIYTAIATGKPLLDSGGNSLPSLASVSIDGVYRLNQMLIDGQCVLNNVNEPGEMGKHTMKFWGSRLLSMMTILNQFAGLSLNVGFTTWERIETNDQGNPTGRVFPHIGGQMDIVGAGLADAMLYCFIRNGKYFVRTQSDGMIQGCKVRNNFSMPPVIDITIGVDGVLPYQKLWV